MTKSTDHEVSLTLQKKRKSQIKKPSQSEEASQTLLQKNGVDTSKYGVGESLRVADLAEN